MPGRERLRRQLLRGNPPPYYSLLPERDCCCAWRGYNAESTTIIHIRMTMPEEGDGTAYAVPGSASPARGCGIPAAPAPGQLPAGLAHGQPLPSAESGVPAGAASSDPVPEMSFR